MIEHTLSIIKPDAIERGIVGKVLSYLEGAGLKIVASKLVLISSEQAGEFYFAHKGRDYFPELTSYLSSGPIIAQVLKGPNAIAANRAVMGDKDPQKADKGTIRGDLATSISASLVHGSDSPESAEREISFFFSQIDLL